MAKTLIDVDNELLYRARHILGLTTKKDTVNTALREVVRREAATVFVTRVKAVFAVPAPSPEKP
jgi:Arc/MetJ family transcription regulator